MLVMSFRWQPPGRPSLARISATLRPGLACRRARRCVSTPRTAGPIGVPPVGVFRSSARVSAVCPMGSSSMPTVGGSYSASSHSATTPPKTVPLQDFGAASQVPAPIGQACPTFVQASPLVAQ
jgi:hypothetical protein